MTVANGLRGRPNHESQANGAMMRVSPLGIFGANFDLKKVAQWASWMPPGTNRLRVYLRLSN